MTDRKLSRFFPLLIAIAGFIVLAPGFLGPFLLDDFSNITANQALHPDEWDLSSLHAAALSNESGPLRRPVSMLSFAANVMTTGMNAMPMKVTNAVLHSVTAALFALFALRVFALAPMGLDARQQRLAALLAALAWAVQPLTVTSTLYVVQRMNLLAALFTFAALLAYLRARPWFFRHPSRAAAWLALAAVLWLLGVLSKESALLAPLYALLLEWLVLGFRDSTGTLRTGWRNLVLGATALGVVVVATVVAREWGQLAGGYEIRGFTLMERLLTEARVIWQYVGMVLLPSHARLGLFLDDISLSTGLLSPWTTLAAIAGLVAWIAIAVALRRRYPLISFGLLLFLAGHLLESTIMPLEIAFEHRNYLPSTGLLIALSATVLLAARRLALRVVEWLPMTAFIVALAFITVIRSLHWADMYMLAQLEVFHHPQSARAQTQLGFVYTQFAKRARAAGNSGWPEFYLDAAAEHFKTAIDANPHHTTPLFLWYLHTRAHGQPFPKEMHEELLRRLQNGLPRADTPGNLDTLFLCVMENCGVPPLEFEEMLRLSLENPRLKSRGRSETLVVAAKYFRYVRNDNDAAVHLLANAAEETPTQPRFRLYLARRLVAAGRYRDALEETRTAATVDTLNIYTAEITELLQTINDKQSTVHEEANP